jgi:putative ABC transport system ATP-binding protein
VPEIVAERVELAFGEGAARTSALRDVNAAIAPEAFTIIMGPSGSGKTSLLSVLGALMTPDKGRVLVDGADLTTMSAEQLAAFRRKYIGFVFQSFRLMAGLTAEENVRMSLTMRGMRDSRNHALRALAEVGLERKGHLKPDAMSGGEKQRVAVARALAHDPMIVLADEPTASLDRASGLQVGDLLKAAVQRPGRALIVVTHDERLRPLADRVIFMEDGTIVREARKQYA